MRNDLTIGNGNLAGKGVYAARDFQQGELVVPYNLKQLTQAEFDALPDGEWEWTHSFWGKIFLFPEPARYVNHADDPSTYPDLERMGDYALRPIKQGEAITINDKLELQNELDTFVQACTDAAETRDFPKVAPLIADDAVLWASNGAFTGKTAIQTAFEKTWAHSHEVGYTMTDLHWAARNYWVSACTFTFRSAGMVRGMHHVDEGHCTTVLRRIAGSWRVVHAHVST